MWTRLRGCGTLLLGLTLPGCATLSLAEPAGRHVITYAGCLGGIYGYTSGTPGENEARTLSRLAAEVATSEAFTTDQGAIAPFSAPVEKVPQTVTALRVFEQTNLQKFMDCYAGKVDPIDYEARLLRGHMILAMIANYSATVVGQANAAKKAQYAHTALGLIADAELGLRTASYAQYQYALAHAKATADGTAFAAPAPMSPPAGSDTYSDRPLRTVSNVSRIDKILAVAGFADGVALRNAETILLSDIAEAASNVSPYTIAEDIAGKALNGLGAAIRSNAYEGAEFAAAGLALSDLAAGPDSSTDARTQVNTLIEGKTLVSPPAGTGAQGSASGKTIWTARFEDWAGWDKIISAACTGLSSSAMTTPASTCLPTDDQITTQSEWAPPKT